MIQLRSALTALLCLLPLASCGSLKGPPSLSTNTALASRYVFRGVVQHEHGVAQLDGTAAVQGSRGETYSGTVWTNLDLDNDTGQAVLPDENGGELSEIDLIGDVAFQVGDLSASMGFANYNFPNNVGRSTTELYVGGSLANAPLSPALSIYWDVDQVGGLYALLSGGRSFTVQEGWIASLGASLGWADNDQGAAYWGAASGGLADLTFSAGVDRILSEYGSVGVALNASTVIDGDLEDGLESAGLDPEQFWVSVVYSWSL